MRLLVDAQCITSTSSLRGIGRYALSLTRALVQSAAQHRVEVLLGAGADPHRLLRARTALEQFLPARAIHVFDAPWPWQHSEDAAFLTAAEAAASAAVVSLQPDAVLVLSTFERDDETVLPVGPATAAVPTAGVLYDLMPALAPGTYLMGPEADAYWRRFERMARYDALLAISEHSARQGEQALGARRPPTTNIAGAPYPVGGSALDARDLDDADLVVPDRFVLTVGGDHPRKNLDRLVQAWARVPAAVRAGSPLVVACGLNPGTVRRLTRSARRAGLRPADLVLTGRVSERRLAALYARASLFVFPSVEEGLGMPPLEAMHAGCPTLLARGSSLSELTDDEATFFDALDADDMASRVTAALTDEGALEALRDTAARTAAAFTWERTAKRAWAALDALPDPPARPAREHRTPVRLSDPTAVAALTAAPAPVLLDVALEPGPRGVLGLPVEPRAALAAATVLLAASPTAASDAVRQGLLDHPVLLDEADLVPAGAHDFHAAYADALSGSELPRTVSSAVVAAARRAPRWTLARPRPVWLLLGVDGAPDEGEDAAVDLVEAALEAAGLAAQVDVAVAPAAALPELHDQLRDARCRGTRIVALHRPADELETPQWCTDVRLRGAAGPAATWREEVAASLAEPRTTGWPWAAYE